MHHIDAYAEYFSLVGNTDGGVPLSEEEYEELKEKAKNADDLFVYWRNDKNADCVAIGPASPCVCGHRYRDHAWYESQTKKLTCRVKICRCLCFSYIPVRGSRTLYCRCKHASDVHDTRGPHRCSRCNCTGFDTPMRCGTCDQPANKHKTIVETRDERLAAGKPVKRIYNPLGPMGGLLDHMSLAGGDEREPRGAQPEHLPSARHPNRQ